MSAFKQFLSTDVIVSPLVVNKSFTFYGSASCAEVGIQRFIGINVSPFAISNDITNIDNFQSISGSLVYNSIKQLYYTNYIPNPISGSPYVTNYLGQVVEDNSQTDVYSRFYNYEQTSLFQTSSATYTSNYGYSRYFPTQSANFVVPQEGMIGVLSIPKNLFGDYINPNSFYMSIDIEESGNPYIFTDNGEGLLNLSGSAETKGIINYSHGTIVIELTNAPDPVADWINTYDTLSPFTCSFQSSRTIFETQYKCTIRPEEFNFSLNPSLISGSTEGTVYNFVTSSYFSPYVTTVGFYNENQELLMVAKLGQPLPTSTTTDTTILVNIDK
jgi:hypothetical protein